MGMNTSDTPHISPKLEPETMMALTLRYVEDDEAVADQYLRAMLRLFMFDLYSHQAFQLMRDIVTESTNDIGNFEGGVVAAEGTDLSQFPLTSCLLCSPSVYFPRMWVVC